MMAPKTKEAIVMTSNFSLDPDIDLLCELRDRPILTAQQAFQLLQLDKSTGYGAIRRGDFPVPTIRVGRCIRVPTAPLMRLLVGEPETDDQIDTA
jgi:hypothetical protein